MKKQQNKPSKLPILLEYYVREAAKYDPYYQSLVKRIDSDKEEGRKWK